jgi:hypothetical protein
MILNKIGEEYKLYGEDGSCIATTQESPHKKLSKENCDKVFGVINIIDLAKRNSKHSEEDYIEGFIKAMELNKDKLFTVEDMISAYHQGANDGASYESACGDHDSYEQMKEAKKESEEDYSYFIESLQQPKEIKVEMIYDRDCYSSAGWCDKLTMSQCIMCTPVYPLKDENGCLILKKK